MPWRLRWACCVVVALVQPACRSIGVWESGSDTKQLKGIPFYAKTAVIKQTTSRVHSWRRVTLTVLHVYEDPGKSPRKELTGTHVVDVPSTKRSDLASIQRRVVAFNGEQYDDPMTKVDSIIAELENISFDPDTLSFGTGRLVGNTVEQMVVTDYSRRLYLSSGKTWPGSTKVAAELAADGTLSKAEGAVESKPAEFATALATLFPATEAFTSLLKLNKEQATAILENKVSVELKLEATQMGMTDEFSKVIRDTTVKRFEPLTGKEDGVSAVRKPLSSSQKEPTKDDAPKIGFEGSVVLPAPKKEGKP